MRWGGRTIHAPIRSYFHSVFIIANGICCDNRNNDEGEQLLHDVGDYEESGPLQSGLPHVILANSPSRAISLGACVAPFRGEINLQLARHLALASIYIVYITNTPAWLIRGYVSRWPQLLAPPPLCSAPAALPGKCGLISSRPSPAAIFTFFSLIFWRVSSQCF